MESQQLISPDKLSVVEFTAGEYWVRLALRLADEYTGGDLVEFAHDATVAVEGADKLSSSYSRANWASGIASGALYAFRTLRIPRQRLVVTELSGRLRASDMDAVANSAAIVVAKLADKKLPNIPTEGWSIQTRTSEQRLPTSSRESPEESASAGALKSEAKQVATIIAASADPVGAHVLFQQLLRAELNGVQQLPAGALEQSCVNKGSDSGSEKPVEPGPAADRPCE